MDPIAPSHIRAQGIGRGTTAVRFEHALAPRRVFGGDSSARLLLAGTPRQVLARILPGDPLDLRARCGARLRSRAQFGDVDRIVVRAQARIARAAARWRAQVGLGDWLRLRIDEAIDDMLDVDLQSEPEPASPMALLSEPLGLSAQAMARGCRRFNALDDAVRHAFFVLVVEGYSLAEAGTRLEQSATSVARLARKGLEAFRGPEASRLNTPLQEPQHESDRGPAGGCPLESYPKESKA